MNNNWPEFEDKTKPVGLIISDDPRLYSGVGTQTNLIGRGLMKEGWNLVHLGGAVRDKNEPPQVDSIPEGKRIIFPVKEYGHRQLIREVIKFYNPSFGWLMTDPRYFEHVFMIEDEIRQKMPIIYYTIWDNPPTPKYNWNYYNSCDALHCISQVTYNIVTQCKEETQGKFDVKYIPHGINTNTDFYPIEDWDKKFKNLSDNKAPDLNLHELRKNIVNSVKQYRNPDDIKFIVFWNNRNIRRKMAQDVMRAFSMFAEGKDNVMLLMKTDPVDENGSDLPRVHMDLFPKSPIVMFPFKIPTEELNRFYNFSQCTVNIASNEGFGLSSLESMATGTPIINNMTGGLQDQISFVDENKELRMCGIPIQPAARNIVGAVTTPYIFEDRVNVEEVTNAIQTMYEIYNHDREVYDMWSKNCRTNALENFTDTKMVGDCVKYITETVNNFKPRPRYYIYEF